MFDEKRADRAVKFFEKVLTHTEGRWAGKPFILPPWQKTIIRDIFGTIGTDGFRQYQKAYIEIPKKNGKSELGAGIALYCLFMDGENGAKVISAASTRKQASLVFDIAAQMVRNSPVLKAAAKIVISTKTIYIKGKNAFYRVISADAGTEDGVNPSCVIFDELHRQKNRKLWSVLSFGSATRDQPLLFTMTTAGVRDESPVCWEQHEYALNVLAGNFSDPRYYAVVYAAPEDADWTSEKVHIAANPAAGDFIDIKRIREECKEAQRSPAAENEFRRLRLNQWPDQVARWLPMEDWRACGRTLDLRDLEGRECWAGLDLSIRLDLTALVLVFMIEGKTVLLPFFFLPRDGITAKSVKDRVPYDAWAKNPAVNLELHEGNSVDFGRVRKRVNELREVYNIQRLGFDKWNAAQLGQELEADGLPTVAYSQQFAGMSGPSKEFETRVRSHKLVHPNDPILNWNARCVAIRTDPAGNIRPDKPDHKKSSNRIDGIVASIMPVDLAVRAAEVVNPYAERGIVGI